MPRVIHFEIHADDPERAANFYRQLFDWDIQKWDGPLDYWLITTGADDEPGINGAILRRQHPLSGQDAVIAYVCTIEVDDLDLSIQRAAAAGGDVAMPRMPVPGIGWMTYFKDTEGNVFGMMQSDPAAG